jgi:hypothetical protein
MINIKIGYHVTEDFNCRFYFARYFRIFIPISTSPHFFPINPFNIVDRKIFLTFLKTP